jgi:endonuclease/exonuclease/phosphatase (EEP) superfamily protein YafD
MIRILIALLGMGAIAGVALGFAGSLHPAFDTIAHFRWHFSLMLLALVLLGLMLKIRRAPFIMMVFAAIGIWQSGAGNRMGQPDPAVPIDGKSHQLLHFNLRFDNPQKSEVLAFIRSTNADILSLSETSRQWEPLLATLGDLYPYLFHCPEWSKIGGVMILSKFPMGQDKDYCHDYAAIGLTEIEIDGQWIEVGTAHMRWPWPASGPQQLTALRPQLEKIGTNAIIAGDFNATTWSWAMQRFASYSGMRIVRGFGGTWIHKALPAALAPWLGLPIDNVLAKGNIVITRTMTMPPVGSDHLPLLITFSLRP